MPILETGTWLILDDRWFYRGDLKLGVRWPIATPTVSERGGAYLKLREHSRDRLLHCG
jgi:hypothetical protein